MTELYFVRHAEPNYENHDDRSRELSEKGMADRALVTDFLREKRVEYVLSSPFKRAVDTVKEFADSAGCEVRIVEDFRERRVDSGWIEDFRGFSKKQWEDFSYKLSDGEALSEVQRRNVEALKQVVRQYKDSVVVIGSHGTALSTIINYFQPRFGFEGFERIRGLMPWIVYFRFSGEECVKIEAYNLFEKSCTVILEKEKTVES